MPPKLIPLNRSNIDPLIKQHQDQLKTILSGSSSKDEVTAAEFDADQAKEFRYKHYPIILLILKNALKELISSVPPQPDKESHDSKQKGFLYLYDGHCPNYMEDAIKWKKTRMSVKLIVYNKPKGIYKLKNHKNDEGLPVMRRQTWQGNGWRKNEYKLINRENYYKPEADGSFSVNECQTLQDFPVLVHYFRKDDGSPEPSRAGSPVQAQSEVIHNGNSNGSDNNFNNNNNVFNKRKKLNDGQALNIETEPFMMTPVSPNLLFSQFSDGLDDKNIISFTKEELNAFSTDFLQIPSIPANASRMGASVQIPIAIPESSVSIKSYAPDSGPAIETTKMIIAIEGLESDVGYTFSCMLEGNEIPCSEIAPSVIEFKVPPHTPGIVQFWLMCREDSKRVLYSNVAQFYYTPADDSGRLSLAFHNLQSDETTEEIVNKFKHTTKDLDLSNNSLTDIDFLNGFTHLHTLTLDNNQITDGSKWPSLPKLSALYVNSNCINDLQVFTEKLRSSFPSLQYLSMLGNEACPVFSMAPHHYYNYRIFVISKLRKLTQLDSSPVNEEEYRHASCIVAQEDELNNAIKRESIEDNSLTHLL